MVEPLNPFSRKKGNNTGLCLIVQKVDGGKKQKKIMNKKK